MNKFGYYATLTIIAYAVSIVLVYVVMSGLLGIPKADCIVILIPTTIATIIVVIFYLLKLKKKMDVSS